MNALMGLLLVLAAVSAGGYALEAVVEWWRDR